ncbi:unnamed protein product [Chondrus crispus]|uniref:Uncharacterized protein n=1 Tax=Chondrus crispus TaxID=2769 RepID=R7Q657_CHOCR|nr:unnamed protein product [Chondrus crispus]CDF32950.1 unnamed protein product [Chondrus crispus]|eukprot:XP_005712753.1 unnamed protein product [Chondrus crispus]
MRHSLSKAPRRRPFCLSRTCRLGRGADGSVLRAVAASGGQRVGGVAAEEAALFEGGRGRFGVEVRGVRSGRGEEEGRGGLHKGAGKLRRVGMAVRCGEWKRRTWSHRRRGVLRWRRREQPGEGDGKG